jgi:hypothetical protein
MRRPANSRVLVIFPPFAALTHSGAPSRFVSAPLLRSRCAAIRALALGNRSHLPGTVGQILVDAQLCQGRNDRVGVGPDRGGPGGAFGCSFVISPYRNLPSFRRYSDVRPRARRRRKQDSNSATSANDSSPVYMAIVATGAALIMARSPVSIRFAVTRMVSSATRSRHSAIAASNSGAGTAASLRARSARCLSTPASASDAGPSLTRVVPRFVPGSRAPTAKLASSFVRPSSHRGGARRACEFRPRRSRALDFWPCARRRPLP